MCTTALCCAGEALCCAGATCCRCLCKLFSCCGAKNKTFSKIGYVMFQIFWILIAIILLYTSNDYTVIIPSEMDCHVYGHPNLEDNTAACYGLSFVVRISFVLGCFHFIMVLAILPKTTAVSICHDGCWMLKFLIVFAGVIASMWIPNY